MDYKPIFQVTSSIIKKLGKIEAVKEIVETLVIPIALEESFRKEASVKATHYSTKIEGNRLLLSRKEEQYDHTGQDSTINSSHFQNTPIPESEVAIKKSAQFINDHLK